MFTFENHIWKSDILALPGVCHGFSTREGGVSREAHLASMNCGFLRGDDDSTVRENIRLLCSYACASENVVGTPQIHSTVIRCVTPENGGEGITREVPFPADGFVTDCAGVTLLVRVADCAPVLMAGVRADATPVVAALHAGWRGTCAGIAPKAVAMLRELGAVEIYASVGACIHSCCYEVGADMKAAVADAAGSEIAEKYIRERDGKLFADIAGMNRELLLSAGASRVDVCPECTACRPELYHSHRMTGGHRGTMGAVIGIRGTEDGAQPSPGGKG